LLERTESSGEVAVSARTGEGMEALLRAIDRTLHSDPVIDAELRVPQHEGGVLAAIEAGMVVHRREYEGNLVRLTVSGPASLVGRLRKFRVCEDEILRSNGKKGIYGVVEKEDAAIILPVDNGRVWLVEQFRYTIEERAL